MINNESLCDNSFKCDIVICGGGVAGLWLLNRLFKAGFDVILIEEKELGGTQTMASQGMIHGGQRYMLGTNISTHAENVAPLPERWDACFLGKGELDLRDVSVLSETQVMWPTGGRLTHLALNTAKHILKAKARKLNIQDVPEALISLTPTSVYELPEKVLDVGSLVDVLSSPHKARIYKGSVDSLDRDGNLTVSGRKISAKVVICAAGLGNEEFLKMLNADKETSQRRPLRQLMVKLVPYALYGHGISASYKPRVTVTSYPIPSGGYIWYLGGAIADDTLSLSDEGAIAYAKKEMQVLFPSNDWSAKKWGTWYGLRAEAYTKNGRLPNGPVVQEHGNALVVWPTKLTMTPILGDLVMEHLTAKGVFPRNSNQVHQILPFEFPSRASFPWDDACWI